MFRRSCSPVVFSTSAQRGMASFRIDLFPSRVPQPCCPVVFSSCVPHQWPEVYGQSRFFPDCCFPALPKACPQLYPSLLSHLVSQLCCPACSHINRQLVSNDDVQIVYPILFWGRRRYNFLRKSKSDDNCTFSRLREQARMLGHAGARSGHAP